VEPGTQGRTVPVTQDGEAGFHDRTLAAKDAEMSTEISTTTTQAKGLALQTMADAMKFGEMVANSDFAPKDFRGKPASCVLAIQAGAEIGLSPMQALQSIAVVNGRPSIFGDAALAVVKASHVCEYVTESVEGDGEQMVATCTAKRRGYPQPTVVTFTVADAKKAGLWGKSGPWTQYPRRMLQMRARGFALRDAFPDALRGMVTAEEAQDYPTPVVAAEPVTVRPKFDTPTTTAEERADPFTVARLAIESETDIAKLDAMRGRIDQRLKQKSFTASQADELLDQIHARVEFLEAESEVTA
jgi:hypothetical protein